MSGINWDIKHFMADMKEEGGAAAFPVLMALWSMSNRRGRCRPGVRYLCKVTGYSTQPVTEALKYLRRSGAYVLVPYEKRMEDEEKAPPRQHIYELTGEITVAGQKWNYLYLNDDVLLGNVLPDEISPSRILPDRTEVSAIVEASAEIEVSATSENGAHAPRARNPMFDAVLYARYNVDPLSEEGKVIASKKGSVIGRHAAEWSDMGKTVQDLDRTREAWWAWPDRTTPPNWTQLEDALLAKGRASDADTHDLPQEVVT